MTSTRRSSTSLAIPSDDLSAEEAHHPDLRIDLPPGSFWLAELFGQPAVVRTLEDHGASA